MCVWIAASLPFQKKKTTLDDGGGLLGDEVSINTCEASCLINQFREMKESP